MRAEERGPRQLFLGVRSPYRLDAGLAVDNRDDWGPKRPSALREVLDNGLRIVHVDETMFFEGLRKKGKLPDKEWRQKRLSPQTKLNANARRVVALRAK